MRWYAKPRGRRERDKSTENSPKMRLRVGGERETIEQEGYGMDMG